MHFYLCITAVPDFNISFTVIPSVRKPCTSGFIHFFRTYPQTYPQVSTIFRDLATSFPHILFALYTKIIHFIHSLSTRLTLLFGRKYPVLFHMQKRMIPFRRLIQICLTDNFPRSVHVQHRHTAIDDFHAVQRRNVGDGAASAVIHLA